MTSSTYQSSSALALRQDFDISPPSTPPPAYTRVEVPWENHNSRGAASGCGSSPPTYAQHVTNEHKKSWGYRIGTIAIVAIVGGMILGYSTWMIVAYIGRANDPYKLEPNLDYRDPNNTAILAASGKNKATMSGECTIAANVAEPVKLWHYFMSKDAQAWKCTPVFSQLKAGEKVTISSNNTIATNCEGALKIYYTVAYKLPEFEGIPEYNSWKYYGDIAAEYLDCGKSNNSNINRIPGGVLY